MTCIFKEGNIHSNKSVKYHTDTSHVSHYSLGHHIQLNSITEYGKQICNACKLLLALMSHSGTTAQA